MTSPECCIASCRGGDGEVDEPAHLAGLFFIDEEQGVEVLHLGGEAHGMAGEIECLDLRHAALAGEEALPYLGNCPADTADEADAGDDDARAGSVGTFVTWPPSDSFRCSRWRP